VLSGLNEYEQVWLDLLQSLCFSHSEPYGGALTRRGRARNLLLRASQESQKIAPFLKRRTGRSYVHVTPHALCPNHRSVCHCVVIRSFGSGIVPAHISG